MLTFYPPELKDDLIKAIQYFEDDLKLNNILEEFWDIRDANFDPQDYEGSFTDKDIVHFSLPDHDEYFDIQCSYFIELTQELKSAKINNNLICQTNKRYLLRVECLDYDMLLRVDKMLPIEDNHGESRAFLIETKIDNLSYKISLIRGLTPFGIITASEGNYDNNFPPIITEELFVEISYPEVPSQTIIDSLIEAYMFELSASANISLIKSQRPYYLNESEYPEYDNEELTFTHRPILLGKGIPQLYSLYNQASVVTDNDISLLFYYKIFEHVSQTVIQMNKIEAFQIKLSSQRALNPDADFILELDKTFEELKKYKRDKEAIISTVATCCDAVDLYNSSPKFIQDKVSKKDDLIENPKNKLEFLKFFAEVLVDTRNSIAHAKTNYELTGNECPSEILPIFIMAIRLASIYVIRWFCNLPEKSRVS